MSISGFYFIAAFIVFYCSWNHTIMYCRKVAVACSVESLRLYTANTTDERRYAMQLQLLSNA